MAVGGHPGPGLGPGLFLHLERSGVDRKGQPSCLLLLLQSVSGWGWDDTLISFHFFSLVLMKIPKRSQTLDTNISMLTPAAEIMDIIKLLRACLLC